VRNGDMQGLDLPRAVKGSRYGTEPSCQPFNWHSLVTCAGQEPITVAVCARYWLRTGGLETVRQ
jgi:hypothetical protein